MLCHDGWKRRPRRVQSGVNESFVIVCDDGTWYPHGLEENYEGLTELLTSSGKMKTLSLNAYGADTYFLVSETGNVHCTYVSELFLYISNAISEICAGRVPQTWDNLVGDVSNTYMTGDRVRTGSTPMDKDLTYSKEPKHGKGKTDPGKMTKWLSGANTALQVGQLVVSADPAQCQHQ